MSNPSKCGNCGGVKAEGKPCCAPAYVKDRPYKEQPEPECKPGCECWQCEPRRDDKGIWIGDRR